MTRKIKRPNDMTTEEIAKAVFHPKLRRKLQEKIEEIDSDKRRYSSSKSSSQK